MTEPQVLRERAAECRRLADGAITEAAREYLEREAKECLGRAEELDRDLRAGKREPEARRGSENPRGPDGRPINPQKTATPGEGQF
jgi:hypothetical protein